MDAFAVCASFEGRYRYGFKFANVRHQRYGQLEKHLK